MDKSLKEILLAIPGYRPSFSRDVRIREIVCDSRRVSPGAAFVAFPGMRTDGQHFIEDAVERGAVAVISESAQWVPPKVVNAIVPDLRKRLGVIASSFYDHPARDLEFTGVLGTSGKTVVAHLLRELRCGESCPGLLGTIQYIVGKRTIPAYRTTPEPVDLHAMISQMRESELEECIMEVSSHAIGQYRTEGISYKQLILTNLTPEHLNYHGSLQKYIELQEAFIQNHLDGLDSLIVNMDDPLSRDIAQKIKTTHSEKLLTFGLNETADVRAENITFGRSDTRFTLVINGDSYRLVSPLIGKFNLENVLAAFCAFIAQGGSIEKAAKGLFDFEGVRGRMERVAAQSEIDVFVDYMHTVESYRKGLQMLREIKKEGKLITVFGCGGNRDSRVRPEVTRIVSENSDIVFATSDNPRNESVEAIFKDMTDGNGDLKNILFVKDRKSAIEAAIESASSGDTILIAGKGHETFQEYDGCVIPFDDRAVSLEALKRRNK